MADQDNQPQNAGEPNISVVLQYLKDLSFENPGAPQSLRSRTTPPNIRVSVGLQSNAMADNHFEVELRIEARATDGDATLFAVELVYAGIFHFINIPAEQVRPLALIECPRLLFPFARQIVAEASRNGGFPQLLIEPVDFVALYRQQMSAPQGQPTN
jgi:preprotein translocase subunit SecB